MAVLPMFPLGSVLFPGQLLPLHVFEPRYRQLVIDLLQDDTAPPDFGVTMIERGWEVGGGDARSDIGVIARMTHCEALDGGRYALIAVGTTRFRVNTWLPDDPYPLADVDPFPDVETEADGLDERVAATAERLRETLRSIVELQAAESASADVGAVGESVGSGDVDGLSPDTVETPEVTLGDDAALATFQLAAQSPVGPVDRFKMLAATSPMARLDALDEALDDVDAVVEFQRS